MRVTTRAAAIDAAAHIFQQAQKISLSRLTTNERPDGIALDRSFVRPPHGGDTVQVITRWSIFLTLLDESVHLGYITK